MTSNMSGLPPPTVARMAARAVVQDIAVRVVSLPPELNRTPSPMKLQGTVAGQNPDGSVQVQTDRGVISLMLRDRQPLPQGQRVEIDLPAGNPAQQAALRPAPQATQAHAPSSPSAQPSSPSLAGQLASQAATSAAKLDRPSSVKATEIEEALRAAAPKIADLLSARMPPAPLQAGQSVRLIPIPPGQSNAIPLQPGQVIPLPEGELLNALIKMIESLPAQSQSIKAGLVTLLGRMDLSSLQGQPESAGQKPVLPLPVQHLLQLADPEGENNSIRYEPIKLFNPSKPLDVQISSVISTPLRPGAPVPVLPGQVQVIQTAQPPTAGQPAGQPVGQPAGQTVPSQPNQPVPNQSIPVRPSQILAGQVIGFTGQNLPVISVSVPAAGFAQTYVAQFQASNLQPGSPVLLSLIPAMDQSAALPPGQFSSWIQSGTWDSLTDLVQTLHQTNPAMAQAMTQIMPSSAQPQNIGALAMLFLSIVRSGDIESWMPPQILNLLRQTGKADLLRAISSDISLSARAEALPLPQEWRASILPFYHDQQVHKLPLYYKQHEEDGADEGRERRRKTMRFLFDLKLNRMGQVQVDGFLQPERLDMVMRTKTALSLPMQSSMKGLYVEAMEKSNLRGELSFQFRPEQWVSLDIKKAADQALI